MTSTGTQGTTWSSGFIVMPYLKYIFRRLTDIVVCGIFFLCAVSMWLFPELIGLQKYQTLATFVALANLVLGPLIYSMYMLSLPEA